VGYSPLAEGYQPLSLQANRCLRSSSIVTHEFMHALGAYHEQSRTDRDRYVNIHWENIREGKLL